MVGAVNEHTTGMFRSVFEGNIDMQMRKRIVLVICKDFVSCTGMGQDRLSMALPMSLSDSYRKEFFRFLHSGNSCLHQNLTHKLFFYPWREQKWCKNSHGSLRPKVPESEHNLAGNGEGQAMTSPWITERVLTRDSITVLL
ncbi:hypothetical protein TREES_T100018394 [Tupaia chinensis]|uniref:Uncharacterized protein n=1 Tax=Tupaia chinensis TaxID=246437 RepID=L9L6B0_TUPCH|nr:hypothetical protein TREES_T100018394 [Tupaia chinensis]